MNPKTCRAKDAFTGAPVEIRFNADIHSVATAEGAPELYVSPGWVDVQVNGYAGADYNNPAVSEEEIARSIQALFRTGVSRFYATVITNSPENMTGCLANLAKAKETLRGGAAMEGFHVEGPHISPEDGPRGAHPKQWVRPPDAGEFRRWQEAARGQIRMVTLAPEWPQAPRYIEMLVKEGVVAAIGHTGADAARIQDAVRAGATMSTHLGNGAHAVLRRHPNYIWEQLAEDRLMASFIVDGVHLPAAFVKAAVRAKGIGRSVLVTDAAAPSGCAPGRYRVGEIEVELTKDNRIVLAGEARLAASALSMDRGIENLMRLAGLTLGDAVRLATVNAARAGRLAGRQQGLAAGERADFTLFRFDPQSLSIRVEATYVGGERVFG